MRPHTAACIGLLNYLYLQSGGINSTPERSSRIFELRVKTPKEEKLFELRVRDASSNRLEIETGGFWKCVMRIDKNGKRFSIRHAHTPTTHAEESFDLYPGEQVGGSSQSVRSASFDTTEIAQELRNFSPSQSIARFYDKENGVTYDVSWVR